MLGIVRWGAIVVGVCVPALCEAQVDVSPALRSCGAQRLCVPTSRGWQAQPMSKPLASAAAHELSVSPPRLRMALFPEWWQELIATSVSVVPIAVGIWLPRDTHVRSNVAHEYSPLADRASDFSGLVVGPLLTGLSGAAIEVFDQDRGTGGGAVLAIATGAAMFSFGASMVLKARLARCRPLAVTGDGSCDPELPPAGSSYRGDEAYRSFPSGHVASVAGATGALFGVIAKTAYAGGKQNPWRWLGAGIGTVLTLTTVLLRQRAGAHSYQDALVGGGMGLGLGFTFAFAHPTTAVD